MASKAMARNLARQKWMDMDNPTGRRVIDINAALGAAGFQLSRGIMTVLIWGARFLVRAISMAMA